MRKTTRTTPPQVPTTDDMNHSWSATDLLDASFSEPVFRVEGLFPEEGFVVLAVRRAKGAGDSLLSAPITAGVRER